MNKIKQYEDLIFENPKNDDELLDIVKNYNFSFEIPQCSDRGEVYLVYKNGKLIFAFELYDENIYFFNEVLNYNYQDIDYLNMIRWMYGSDKSILNLDGIELIDYLYENEICDMSLYCGYIKLHCNQLNIMNLYSSGKIDWYCLCTISDKENADKLVRYIDENMIDAIVADNINIAVALRFEIEQGGPVVLAKSFGDEAVFLMEDVKFKNIYKEKNEILAKELYKNELNKVIPEALFSDVAEIFACAFKIKKSVL